VTAAADTLELLAPALAFLLLAVPLAHLLGELGFFEAVARRVAHVDGVWAWWLLAAATTAVLNLDTTVVLLTPLYLQVARRQGRNPMVLAVVPLLLANLASSVLPVSNLTTLIASEQFDIGSAELLRDLGPASVAMVAAGFVAHRRWATRLDLHSADLVVAGGGTLAGEPAETDLDLGFDPAPPGEGAFTTDAGGDAFTTDGDRRALVLGGAVVAGLLVAFVVGPVVGVAAWEAVLVADVVLALVLRSLPWRSVPLATALAVALLGVAVALLVPGDRLASVVSGTGAMGAVVGALTAAALTATVDNLPALLAFLQGIDRPALMPVLLGVNAGAVLTPIGSLANLLWMRTARAHGEAVTWGATWKVGLTVGAPAFVAGVAVLAVQRGLFP
jgi:arsenical pump membrane protein